jgi:hypothetical protein
MIASLLIAAAGLVVISLGATAVDVDHVPSFSVSPNGSLSRISNMSTFRFAHSALVNPMSECMTGSDIVTFVKLIEASPNRPAFCIEFPQSGVGLETCTGVTNSTSSVMQLPL